ncbi:MAG: peptide ABC transporter substrate-binding protein [Planctomycetota bacterium]|nr:MAG: peptide ABC transporter substrate-binding protein [Planctomycetota bacterium]
MQARQRFGWCSVVWAASVLGGVTAGCSSQDRSPDAAAPPGSTQQADQKSAAGPSSQPFVLGNAVEPFDPPPLEELDKLQWEDGPVVDSLEQLRAEKAEAGPPPTSVEEALALRNDFPKSRENNDKILAALSQLAPPDGAGVDYEHTFVRHVAGDLNSTNPLFGSSVTDYELSGMAGFSVLAFNRRFEYFADKDIVVSWQRSKDNLVERIVLRDDLTWSDGTPITAHDVEFTYRLIMTDHPELVIPAVRQGTDQLRYVKAYDDRTIVYWHKEPFATRTGNMLWPVLPKHIYEKSVVEDPSMKRSEHHRKYEEQPVVGGPYELVSRVRNQEFVVRRREGWYMHGGQQVRRKPYFKEVRVKIIEDLNTAILALKAGDIQSMELRPEHWESLTAGDDFYAQNTKVMAPEWTEFHVVWNVKSPYFSDKRVRWAMTYAFDYEELLNTICRGLYEQGRGTFNPAAWMFPPDGPQPVKRDLDRAEDLLEFQLMTYTTETGVQVATLWKESLDQIGVTVNVKPTEFAVMQDKTLKHEFDACFAGWGTGADPDMQENIFGAGKQRNYGQYANPEVDKLFEQGRRELDRDKRATIYGQIHMLLWEDQPYTWLFYRNAFFAFNKKLRGYNFSPRGPYDFGPGFAALYGAAE